MLPSYIIQDKTSISNCIYTCNPRYWISNPQNVAIFEHCVSDFCGNCCYCNSNLIQSPTIICYSDYIKSYAFYNWNNRRTYIDLYGNNLSYGGCDIVKDVTQCNYLYNGDIVKFLYAGGDKLTTSNGSSYYALTICKTCGMQMFLDTIGCGDKWICGFVTYHRGYVSCNYNYIHCAYHLIGSCCCQLFNIKFNIGYNLYDSVITENIICKCWRTVDFYFGKIHYTSCCCYNFLNKIPSFIFCKYSNKNIFNVFVSSGTPCGGTIPNSMIGYYFVIGDIPQYDTTCIYNKNITLVNKIIGIPRCITCNANYTPNSIRYDNIINSFNNIYTINASFCCVPYAWNSAIGIDLNGDGTNSAPSINIDLNNKKITTIYLNRCFYNYCSECNCYFRIPIFSIPTKRETNLVIDYYSGYLRFFEYTKTWMNIKSSCYALGIEGYGICNGLCAISPKFLYDDIEDAIIIGMHPLYACGFFAYSDPYIMKIPTCVNIMKNFICKNNEVVYGVCYYLDNNASLFTNPPIISTYDILDSYILCGTNGCCCGYITDTCATTSKPNFNINLCVIDCCFSYIKCTTQNKSCIYCATCVLQLSTSRFNCYTPCNNGTKARHIQYFPF